MTSRPLILGQAPSRGRDGCEPLSGRSGERLATLCGLDLAAFLARFERANLLDGYPGAAAKGDLFVSPGEARRLADEVVARLEGRTVVLLGSAVVAAFRVGWRAFEWHPHRGAAALAWCPHPSGVSLWWNERANVVRARAFWTALAAEPAGGPRVPRGGAAGPAPASPRRIHPR